MRLGAYPCQVKKDTLAHKAYKADEISERHRHRYEFNNEYREKFQKAGMKLSGVSPNGKLVEMIELEDHPWFLAVQFHPEFKSKPDRAHPLFREFIHAALAFQEAHGLKISAPVKSGTDKAEVSAQEKGEVHA